MNISNMGKITAAVIIGVILVIVVAVPIISEGKIRNDVEQDSNTYKYHATDTIGVGTYTVDNGTLKLNDETIGSDACNILSDKFRVIFYNGGLTLYDSTLSTQYAPLKSLTVNSDGSYSYIDTSDNEVDMTENITWFMGVAPTGDYVMGIGYFSVNVNANDICYITTTQNLTEGTTTYDPGKYIVNARGTINDLTTNAYLFGSEWASVNAESIINGVSAVSEGVYNISNASCSVDFILDETENADKAFIVFVPASYQAVSNDPLNNMLDIIPIIMVIGLIMGVLGAFALNRDD